MSVHLDTTTATSLASSWLDSGGQDQSHVTNSSLGRRTAKRHLAIMDTRTNIANAPHTTKGSPFTSLNDCSDKMSCDDDGEQKQHKKEQQKGQEKEQQEQQPPLQLVQSGLPRYLPPPALLHSSSSPLTARVSISQSGRGSIGLLLQSSGTGKNDRKIGQSIGVDACSNGATTSSHSPNVQPSPPRGKSAPAAIHSWYGKENLPSVSTKK